MKACSVIHQAGVYAAACMLAVCLYSVAEAPAQTGATSCTMETVRLPEPETEGGRPLMQVLLERKSSRSFSREDIPLQTLSNLLWAAFGINRPDSGKRTAPSAVNRQETDIYVARSDGLYLYDAAEHSMKPVSDADVRGLTGYQAFAADAPLNLIYVADFSRMAGFEKRFYSAAGAGSISQNVYLFCASEGLATVVRGLVPRPALAAVMKLGPARHIVLAQSVGYPPE